MKTIIGVKYGPDIFAVGRDIQFNLPFERIPPFINGKFYDNEIRTVYKKDFVYKSDFPLALVGYFYQGKRYESDPPLMVDKPINGLNFQLGNNAIYVPKKDFIYRPISDIDVPMLNVEGFIPSSSSLGSYPPLEESMKDVLPPGFRSDLNYMTKPDRNSTRRARSPPRKKTKTVRKIKSSTRIKSKKPKSVRKTKSSTRLRTKSSSERCRFPKKCDENNKEDRKLPHIDWLERFIYFGHQVCIDGFRHHWRNGYCTKNGKCVRGHYVVYCG